MRVLQLIDSLRSGGAERMSVNYANALAKRIEGSFLCCSRMEGLLKSQLSPEVGYLFLEKRNTFDFSAINKLRLFVIQNKIDILHAHGSSWFLGILIKLCLPKLKLVWHDHWGERALSDKKPGVLSPASHFFDGIITVNKDLEKWARKHLKTRRVKYFLNFLRPRKDISNIKETLEGGKSFKILQLANLKSPKDHLNGLKALEFLKKENLDISLHLVGKDEEDAYSRDLKDFIRYNELQNIVFFYGEKENIEDFLREADMGILTSKSEGLPVALLEYGRAGLPVVCTKVGQCSEVLEGYGKLVESQNSCQLATAIKWYIENIDQRKRDAIAFQSKIFMKYSEEKVIPEVLKFYNDIVQRKN